MLLDHDTLFTARREAEELRRFAVLHLLPNTLSTESLGSMEVETDETQPCGSLPASPWSCSPDGSIPCGARSPNSIGMVCASEDQLEANGGLVLFYPNAPDGKHPRPPRFCIPGNVASAVTSIGTALSRALQLSSCPVKCPLHCLVCMSRCRWTRSIIGNVYATPLLPEPLLTSTLTLCLRGHF